MEPYEVNPPTRRHRSWFRVGAALAFIAGVAALVWALVETPKERDLSLYPNADRPSSQEPRPEQPANQEAYSDPAGAVATSGTERRDPTAAPGEDASAPDVVRNLDQILGGRDPKELVGRQVEFEAPVLDDGNPVTFWIGTGDDRLLVVMGRDSRDVQDRQTSTPPSHGIAPVQRGQQAIISGTIQEVPSAEERYNWRLTREQTRELERRGVYVRAHSVRTNGHGE